MAEITLDGSLAQEIRTEAEMQGLSVEELLRRALWHLRYALRRQRLELELRWYESQPLEFRARFAGEFVAVCKQSVVDHDSDREALNQRISERYPSTPVLVIPAEGPQEVRIYSPRVEQL